MHVEYANHPWLGSCNFPLIRGSFSLAGSHPPVALGLAVVFWMEAAKPTCALSGAATGARRKAGK
jgi:hypothetical protein